MTTQEAPPIISRRATRTGLPQLGQYLAEAFRYRTFALYWSKADIKARNFETVLGRLWHFLNPFLFGLIYFVLIGILSDGGLSDLGRLSFIVGNLYVWTFFSSTVITGAGSVLGGAGGVLAQSAIPRVVLPFASTLTAGNLFLRSLIAYVPLHIVSAGLHWEMLWMPLLLVLTGMFGFGLALLLAVVNVYFRDVSRLLPHFMRLWLYMSPTIWAYTRLLDETGWVGLLGTLNPMFSGMTAWTIAFGGPLSQGEPSMVSAVLTFAAWAFGTLLVGFFTFVSREDEFAVRD